MRDATKPAVIGKDGLSGVLLDPLPDRLGPDKTVRVGLTDGTAITVPADTVVVASDGTYLIPFGPGDFEHLDSPRTSTIEKAIPVIAEELVVGKRPVPTGGVRVIRRVLEHEQTVEVPLLKERVDVRRIVVDREVDGPLPIRREGDTTIIPIVEEELVVAKRYRLKEEVHVTRTLREEIHRERVAVNRQEPVIEHLDAHGHAHPAPAVSPSDDARPRRRPRKTILGDA